jgi:hypothetical protein
MKFINQDGNREAMAKSVGSVLEETGWEKEDMKVAVELIMNKVCPGIAVSSGV